MNPSSDPSDPSDPDVPGFEAFVSQRSARLFSIARGVMRSDADAEDLLHETLARAFERWDRIAAADDPAAYVNRMLVNAAISWWRRGVRREHPTDPADLVMQSPPDRDDALRTTTERDAVLNALRRLPRRQRAVIVLRYYEGQSDVEIAVTMGIGTSTVRSTASRALASLRGQIAVRGLGDDRTWQGAGL